MISWSYAFRRMRIRCRGPSAISPLLLENLCHGARTDRAPALADRETEPLVHRDRLAQLDCHDRVVTGDDHLGALGELDRPGHIRRAEVELRAVVAEERLCAPAPPPCWDFDVGPRPRPP